MFLSIEQTLVYMRMYAWELIFPGYHVKNNIPYNCHQWKQEFSWEAVNHSPSWEGMNHSPGSAWTMVHALPGEFLFSLVTIINEYLYYNYFEQKKTPNIIFPPFLTVWILWHGRKFDCPPMSSQENSCSMHMQNSQLVMDHLLLVCYNTAIIIYYIQLYSTMNYTQF